MRIMQVVISTHIPGPLAAFYREILELPVHSSNGKIDITIGSSVLSFEPTHDGSQPFYHLAFNIPCNKIDAAKDWLSQKTKLLWMEDYQSVVADFVNWNARSVYFYDVAGNVLELIARNDLHNESHTPFSAKDLLSISEAGLVFPADVYDGAIADLMKRCDLPYFAKQPPLPQFKAIGDDEGLFIVVPQDRAWYPTDKTARLFPIAIDFEHEDKMHRFKSR